MVDLGFAIEGARIEQFAASPTLVFKLRITNPAAGTPIQNVIASCQLRIEAARRRYSREEQERLRELFGEGHRFEERVHNMLWTQTSFQTPAFESECSVDLPIACTFDLDVAATKYFYGLDGGEVPLSFLFSGTVFTQDADGFLQMEPIPWSKEESYRFPARLWRDAIDRHYAGSGWLRLGREVFDEIHRLKRRRGFTSWDQTLRALLEARGEETVP